MKVGTKSLKNRLSHYLRRVRAGETVTVTDRGASIAEIRAVAPAADREAAALGRLADEGLVSIGTGAVAAFTALRLKRGGRLSTAVLEDRE
jgi:prevent-host-death family protein